MGDDPVLFKEEVPKREVNTGDSQKTSEDTSFYSIIYVSATQLVPTFS